MCILFEKLMILTAFFACDKVDTGSLCLKIVLIKQYQSIHNTAEWEFDTALITYYCIKYDGFYKEDRCFILTLLDTVFMWPFQLKLEFMITPRVFVSWTWSILILSICMHWLSLTNLFTSTFKNNVASFLYI